MNVPKPDYSKSSHPAFDEWLDNLPYSFFDLFGYKTYKSSLGTRAPKYIYYGDVGLKELGEMA